MNSVKRLNVALIGSGFMGKAHSLAYAAMPMFFWPAPAIPVRKVVADVTDGYRIARICDAILESGQNACFASGWSEREAGHLTVLLQPWPTGGLSPTGPVRGPQSARPRPPAHLASRSTGRTG